MNYDLWKTNDENAEAAAEREALREREELDIERSELLSQPLRRRFFKAIVEESELENIENKINEELGE